MTERTIQTDIEAIAGIIADWPRFPGDRPVAEMAIEIDEGDGWTIERSAPLGGVLRIEGVMLGAHLAAAIALAARWQR